MLRFQKGRIYIGMNSFWFSAFVETSFVGGVIRLLMVFDSICRDCDVRAPRR